MNKRHMDRVVWRLILVCTMVAWVAGCAERACVFSEGWRAYAGQAVEHRLRCSGAFPGGDQAPGNSRSNAFRAESASRVSGSGDAAGEVSFVSWPQLVAGIPSQESEGALASQPSLFEDAVGIEHGPLPGFRETVKRDLTEAPGLLWHHTKLVYGDPLNLVFILGAGGASAALRPEVDDDIEDYYDGHHSLKADWRDAFGAAGNPATHFALAGVWYLAGQQLQHEKTYEVGKRMLDSLLLAGLSTTLLKVAANTESPNGEELSWPSGHVSSTMVMATVLNDAYGPVVGLPMFGLTGLVALERLDSREHHFSDVVFGAALGWVVAETIMKEHRPEILGGELVPYIDPEGRNAGVAWVKTLGDP